MATQTDGASGGQLPTMAGTAVIKVLGTVELLENILLQLNAVQICGVQRTCRAIYDTTRGSVKLQRATFMSSEATADTERKLNPIFETFALRPQLAITQAQDDIMHLDYIYAGSLEYRIYSASAERQPPILRYPIPDMQHPPTPTRTLSMASEASWRRMYACTRVTPHRGWVLSGPGIAQTRLNIDAATPVEAVIAELDRRYQEVLAKREMWKRYEDEQKAREAKQKSDQEQRKAKLALKQKRREKAERNAAAKKKRKEKAARREADFPRNKHSGRDVGGVKP